MADALYSRVFPKAVPYQEFGAQQKAAPWMPIAEWPAVWLKMPAEPPVFAVFRLVVNLSRPVTTRIHVSADERYELYVDGARFRGPERGGSSRWYFESFDLSLPAGSHVLLARVWALGKLAPVGQVSVRPGFILLAEGEAHDLLTTGHGNWEVAIEQGVSATGVPEQLGEDSGAGPAFVFDCSKLTPDWQMAPADLQQAEPGELPALSESSGFAGGQRHYLTPGELRSPVHGPCELASVRYAAKEDLFAKPDRAVDERKNDKSLQFALAAALRGGEVTIPAKTTLRVIIDLQRYECFYPVVQFSGGKGATIRLRYAEVLADAPEAKSHPPRDIIDGRIFRGLYDEFRADGRSHAITMPWWRAGRFVQAEVRTGSQALKLAWLAFQQEHYDLGPDFAIETNVPEVMAIAPVALRTLRMCAHDACLASPYPTQHQDVDDTRLQSLLSFMIEPDAALARKALRMFDASPREGTLIPPAALGWVCMIADDARWRDDKALVMDLLPGARYVMERFLGCVDKKDLLVSPRGWNYVDAAEGFTHGVPPGGEFGGRSSVLQWQLIYTLIQLSELEAQFGTRTFAKQWRTAAENLLESAETHYWDKKRQLFADDLDHTSFSQHAQIFAVLSRLLRRDRSMKMMNRTVREKDLAQCGICFVHYLFEAISPLDKGEYLRSRLPDWRALVEDGCTTFPEHFGTTRSQCHAGSAHVLYHIIRTLAGIRPDGWGMEAVLIEPHLLEGEYVKVSVAHPKGMMHFHLAMTDEGLVGKGRVPAGVKVSGGGRHVVIEQE